jgi:hypothetical protein
MIVRATPPRRTTTPVANVIGDSNNANSPNTTSHTGMIAVRLNDIDMMVTLREKRRGLLDPASLR